MSKRSFHLSFILSFIFGIFVTVQAQPELDISFNGTGRVLTGFGSGSAEVKDVLIQADGRVVAVGTWRDSAGPTYFALTRYNTDGSIDTTFGNDGRVVTDLDPSVAAEGANAGALQPDGKIIAAGYVSLSLPGQGYFALARYSPDGTLDETFGSGGKVVTSISTGPHEARDVALGQDGTIVAAGSYHNGISTQTLIAKYGAGGDLSWTKTDTRGNFVGAVNIAESVVILAGGRILTCGNASGLDTGITFTGYTANGDYDVTLGAGGRILLSNTAGKRLKALTLAANSRFIAGGSSEADFMVARFFSIGGWDISFNGSGSAVTPMGGGSQVNSLAIGPNGRIVAAGVSSPAEEGFAVAVYTANGLMDNSFSGDGRLTFGFDGSSVTVANSATIDSLGRIVLGGTAAGQFAIARLYTLQPALASIGGQARTPEGTPLRGVRVGLTDAAGLTRWAITSNFGFFTFDSVPTGQTYNLFVRGSKTHIFESRDIGLNEAASVDLIGTPRESKIAPISNTSLRKSQR